MGVNFIKIYKIWLFQKVEKSINKIVKFEVPLLSICIVKFEVENFEYLLEKFEKQMVLTCLVICTNVRGKC